MAITRIKAETALSGTIPSTNISQASMANVSTGTSWQAVQTTNFAAEAGKGYFIDTTSGAITVTLPASPTVGDSIQIVDYAGTFATNNVTLNRNGNKIQGTAANGIVNTNRQSVTFTYIDSTKGWIPSLDATTIDYGAQYTSATGGTVTTSGDYKIHTFTGDGCFVVSLIGNPAGGGSTADYLIVAGGGGGGTQGGGGGGAGGMRFSASTYCAPAPSNPRAATAMTLTATTYPVTVGGGGSGASGTPGGAAGPGATGSNSSFNSITSAGGGGGGKSVYTCGSPNCAPSGGSGGGRGKNSNGPGGAGNTPPTSPSQGFPGGATLSTPAGGTGAGAGGGAGAAGGCGSGPATGPGQEQYNGDGGVGLQIGISGSCTYYAGGGGGGSDVYPQPSYPATPVFHGVGGTGGGGSGAWMGGNQSDNGVSGTTNTGGGGGGAELTGDNTGGAGGSGVVIIRYKFQN